MFTIFETSSSELQLSVLNVLYITKYQPILCKQKEFYNLLSFNSTVYPATKPDLVPEKTKEKFVPIPPGNFFSFFTSLGFFSLRQQS